MVHISRIAVVFLIALSALADDQKPTAPAPIGSKHITTESRMSLIRGLEAEFVFLRRTFPMGEKGLTVKRSGEVSPDAAQLRQLVMQRGTAGRPGDRAQITNIEIRDHDIYLEINGGPRHKKKWYEHISVGMGGGETQLGQPDTGIAKGSSLLLEFDKFVPDMTVDQAKQLLAPVLDFSSKSANKSFTDSPPPKVKDALKEHRVLVGMNRELV